MFPQAQSPHFVVNGTASLVYFSVALVAFARLTCVHHVTPVNKKRIFHGLLVMFAAMRTGNLWTTMYKPTAYTEQIVLDRISFSLFFSLLSFLVVQWCAAWGLHDVLPGPHPATTHLASPLMDGVQGGCAKPQVLIVVAPVVVFVRRVHNPLRALANNLPYVTACSRFPTSLRCRYAVANLVFYGVVFAASILSLSFDESSSVIDFPVTVVASATLVVSGLFVLLGVRLRRRADSLESAARTQLVSVLRALGMVLALCTILFAVQCFFFVSRIVDLHEGPGDDQSIAQRVQEDKCGNVTISYLWCNLLGVWLPELVPTACMLLLMWNKDDAHAMYVLVCGCVYERVLSGSVCCIVCRNLSAVRKLGGRFFQRTKLREPLLSPDESALEPVGITTKDGNYGTPTSESSYVPPAAFASSVSAKTPRQIGTLRRRKYVVAWGAGAAVCARSLTWRRVVCGDGTQANVEEAAVILC